jgi:hypothetical protein
MEETFSSRSAPVAKAGDNSGNQRKVNARRWKPLQSNGNENVTVDTTVCA